jgi:hypothetical protein
MQSLSNVGAPAPTPNRTTPASLLRGILRCKNTASLFLLPVLLLEPSLPLLPPPLHLLLLLLAGWLCVASCGCWPLHVLATYRCLALLQSAVRFLICLIPRTRHVLNKHHQNPTCNLHHNIVLLQLHAAAETVAVMPGRHCPSVTR